MTTIVSTRKAEIFQMAPLPGMCA